MTLSELLFARHWRPDEERANSVAAEIEAVIRAKTIAWVAEQIREQVKDGRTTVNVERRWIEVADFVAGLADSERKPKANCPACRNTGITYDAGSVESDVYCSCAAGSERKEQGR